MISSWKLNNFKSIKDGMMRIDFRKLTVIAGANSSGKSTLIQSILLVMQTLANRKNVALQLNGELVTLGRSSDVWHNSHFYNEDGSFNPLIFEIFISNLSDEESNIYIKVNFWALEESTEVLVIQAEYAIGTGNNPKNYDQRLNIQWDQESNSYLATKISSSLQESIEQYLYTKGLNDIRPLDNAPIKIEDFYPRSILVEARTPSQKLNWENALINPNNFPGSESEEIDGDVWNFLVETAEKLSLQGLTKNRILAKPKRAVETFGDYKKWFNNLKFKEIEELRHQLEEQLGGPGVTSVKQWYAIPFFECIENSLIELFTNHIRYLGANRLAPTLLFRVDTNNSWSEVGLTGENLATAIKEYANRKVHFWNPQKRTKEQDSLMNALVIWLQFFELIDNIEAMDSGKMGTSLKIFNNGVNKELDLTSVGFGTSQILPIIVQGLLTPYPNGMFIVEQPEVHLHPGVQSKLADFFLGLARIGIQCFIETHSEHIINRLRLRIVEDYENDVLNLIRIYFVEKIDAQSQFIAVEPNEYGAISEWPDGFFDQVENEHLKIARLATQKKKGRK